MNTENIDEMVRVIAGSFPNSGVFTPDVVKAWQRHEVIANMTVEEARAVQKRIVTNCREFPAAFEVAAIYWKMFAKPTRGCTMCAATGWKMPPSKTNGDPGTMLIDGIEYRYVTKCECCQN